MVTGPVCYICRLRLNGPEQYRDHLAGARHLKIQKRADRAQGWSSLPEGQSSTGRAAGLSSSRRRGAPTVAAQRPVQRPAAPVTGPSLEPRPLGESETAGASATVDLAGLDFDHRLAVDQCRPDVGEGGQRPRVYVLVIGGNLAHRLYKLGVELPPEEQSGAQRMLAYILEKSGLRVETRPGRTPWSNGACVYLTPEDARAVDWADKDERVRVLGEDLQSKHLMCSDRHLPLIKELLESRQVPVGVVGREASMIKGAGRIKQEVCKELP